LIGAWVAAVAAVAAFAAAVPEAAAAHSLAAYVNPFVGTKGAARNHSPGNTFPGATVPFGMVQWSPDTERLTRKAAVRLAAAQAPQTGGPKFGYDYGSRTLQGLSLTHMSGAGCPQYGDFPFLPTTARLAGSPVVPGSSAMKPRYESRIDYRKETASPGYYQARLATTHGTVNAQLTATTRTGFGRFTYPRTRKASMLIDAGGSARNDTAASVRIDPGHRQVTGAATSGAFCSQRNRYRVYFAARFARPFKSFGTWGGGALSPGSTSSSSTTPGLAQPAQAGAYLTFDARKQRRIDVGVGISFVSVAGARRNLRAESSGRRFPAVRRAARNSWSRALDVIRVRGGTLRELRTFYTALYHALIAPRTFSDANRLYPGMDGRVHSASHYTQYADFSGWDVYRSEIPLLAMLYPSRVSDIVRSLLADAGQSGCLPKWSVADGQTMEMIGDPADQSIASAAALGADAFSHATALHAMLTGATTQCRSPNASYLERQGLLPYEQGGYIPLELNVQKGNATSAGGSPDAVFGTASTTLEYASADFAIAQFAARFTSDRSAYGPMMRRSGNWRTLFDRRTRYIEPRLQSGGFPSNYSPSSNLGFAEGSSAQYTWAVPFDPAGLARRIGGHHEAVARLGRFVRILNDVRHGFHSTHALLGNEPSLGSPWLFDWLRRPDVTQRAVRRAITKLYGPGPAGLPGNDDLGQTSSWYILGALGLYPAVPGVGMLAVASPLFPHATLRLGGAKVTIAAPHAAAGRPYVDSLLLDGHHYGKPWLPYCALARGARLRFGLASKPHHAWGASGSDRPPSFGVRARMPRSTCSPR
jgi:predicted alpha-1,2-mannosidase